MFKVFISVIVSGLGWRNPVANEGVQPAKYSDVQEGHILDVLSQF